MKRVELYSLYERIWHWLQAAAIILLTLTGMAIHSPEHLPWIGFARAARLHEMAALFTIANGFLALFTHLATGAIRQYLPAPRDMFTQGAEQARYYVFGIFRGDPHPFARSPDKKLNVLQQITYLMILNLLLPLQIVTGALLWEAGRFPEWIERLGGLSGIAAVHVAAAWLFIAFIVMHIYLTTTGASPLAHLRAMILGYEFAEQHGTESATAAPSIEAKHESA